MTEASDTLNHSGDVPLDAECVLALLTEHRETCRALLSLAQDQERLIRSGDAPALLTLLGRRQAGIERLSEIGVELAPVRQDWSHWLADQSPAIRESVSGLLEAVRTVMDELRVCDERDYQQLAERRGQTAHALGKVGNARAAGRAYGVPAAMGDARYTDREI